MKSTTRSFLTAVVAVISSLVVSAATYTGTGADPSDISKTDNWAPSSWAATDALTLDGRTNNLAYKMTAALPAADTLNVKYMGTRTIDFGVNLTTVSKIVFDHNTLLTVKGGAENLTEFRVNNSSKTTDKVCLDSGVYHIGTGRLLLYDWNPRLSINSGAELVIDNVNNTCGAQPGTSSHNATLSIDGGKLTIKAQETVDRYLQFRGHKSVFEMKNGATFDNSSSAPGLQFCTDVTDGEGSFSIADSTLMMTNSSNGSRGLMIHPHASTVKVTNSTIKFPQFYCGQFTSANYGGAGTYYDLDNNARDSQFTFNNSDFVAAFRPGESLNSYSGIFFGPKTRGNTMTFDGAKSSYTGAIFALGGETNTLRVKSGTFKATSRFDFAPGHHAHAWFSGGVSTLSWVQSRNTNSTFIVSDGACVSVNGSDFYCSTDKSGVEVTGGNLSVYTTASKSTAFHLAATENYITTTGDGAVTTGKVVFAGSNGRVTVADGGRHVGIRSAGGGDFWSSVTFASGKSGNVLTISNAVFESAMPFAKDCALVTKNGPQYDAVPFTGCPGCRIELAGANAKFLVTAKQRYAGDSPWYSCALGEMIDRSGETPVWTTAAYSLDNPVRVRFCLPAEGWSEAPFRVTSGIAVLGGNAEFEFDASDYTWPVKTTRVPLIYNSEAYDGWGHRKYINVAQLNETNAARFPVNPNGRKAKLALSADGTTLDLVMPGVGGMVIMVR